MAEDPKAVVARGYDAMVERYASWASAIPDVARDRMTAELERRLPPGSSLVDLGCGAGLPSAARLAQRYAVTGVDGSARKVEAAGFDVVIAEVLGTPEPERTTEFLWLLARAPGAPAPGGLTRAPAA